MIERLIDDWLTSANERTYQGPFAHSLAAQGYEVVHVSRHCGMELGKDVLAIDGQRIPCAFQLKDANGKKVSLRRWTSELGAQVVTMVNTAIVHPSIVGPYRGHRSFVVLNGEVEEEVSRWIDDFNRKNKCAPKGHPALELITKGTLLRWFSGLNSNFWPRPLHEIKPLVELWMDDGRGQLNKDKVATVLSEIFSLGSSSLKKNPVKRTVENLIHSTTINIAFATGGHGREDNHHALFEAWVMTYAYSTAYICRHCPKDYTSPSLELLEKLIWNSAERLIEEAHSSEDLAQHDPFSDRILIRVRATVIVGIAAILAIRYKLLGLQSPIATQCEAVIRVHKKSVYLWGETAVPFLFAVCMHEAVFRPAQVRYDQLLRMIIDGIVNVANIRGRKDFGDSYETFEDVFGDAETVTPDENSKNTNFDSRCVEGLWHLFVQLNWKQQAKSMWPALSKVNLCEFRPKEEWMHYLWRAPKGVQRTVIQQRRQSWAALRKLAATHNKNASPKRLTSNPALCMAFLSVFPHRWNTDLVKHLKSNTIAMSQQE